jgi:YHS domain-containing protein
MALRRSDFVAVGWEPRDRPRVLRVERQLNLKETIMMRTTITSAIAGAVLLGLGGAAYAVTGEFNNMCAEGLALHKEIKTDCSVNTVYKGKTLCFGSEQAKTDFMKSPEANLKKAETYYSKHQG